MREGLPIKPAPSGGVRRTEQMLPRRAGKTGTLDNGFDNETQRAR
jgi:hypothetical protein